MHGGGSAIRATSDERASMIKITAVGLASSLGGIVQAAAAFRAGITRAQAIPWLSATGHDGEPVAVIGHPARPLVEGLDGFAAWLRLARLAWDDCWSNTAATTARPQRPDGIGVILVMPRIHLARHGWGDDDHLALLDEHVTARLLAQIGLPIPQDHRAVFACDHGGTAQAFLLAEERLAAGSWRQAIVLAVDSLIDPSSVTWLAEQGRLKIIGSSHGIAPGEAAVCLVLAPADGSAGITVVSSAVHADESSKPRPDPIAVAGSWRGLLPADLNQTERPSVDHWLDHTGEEWRALSWGHLLSSSPLGRTNPRIHLPAEGFGATGAASGALACALALRAFRRGYAKSDESFVWSVDDDGATALIRLCHWPG
jgi:3-oxoacyl-[acyl-carrier-protein] synthase I